MPLRKRRLLTAGLVLLALAIGVIFFVVPGAVEAGRNRSLSSGPYPASPRASALHASLVIADLHADSLLWDRDLLERGTRGQVDVPRLIEGNVALQVFTIVTKTPHSMNIEHNDATSDDVTKLVIVERWPIRTWDSLLERALYQAHKLDDVAARSSGKLTVIHSATELDAYLTRRKTAPRITAGMLGIEGAHALEGDVANVDRVFDAGVRMMAPTHFFDNDIGGSAHGLAKTGLTELGKAMIARMEAKKMIVDLAHASARTIDDVLAIATRPVVVSHTGVRGTCDNNRNLTDAQLLGIARTGGLVGIGYWETASCGRDAAAIARAIRYTANVIGVEHVALGSDFDGSVTTPFDAAGVVEITDTLMTAGFDDSDVARIMGGNTIRFLLANLPP